MAGSSSDEKTEGLRFRIRAADQERLDRLAVTREARGAVVRRALTLGLDALEREMKARFAAADR
jgi:hypothetical protein